VTFWRSHDRGPRWILFSIQKLYETSKFRLNPRKRNIEVLVFILGTTRKIADASASPPNYGEKKIVKLCSFIRNVKMRSSVSYERTQFSSAFHFYLEFRGRLTVSYFPLLPIIRATVLCFSKKNFIVVSINIWKSKFAFK
jgi:hypothetical protein